MKRRSFIQSLLAVPVVAAVAKFVPTKAEPPFTFQGAKISTTDHSPRHPPTSDFEENYYYFRERPNSYLQRRALTGIRKGQLLRNHHFKLGVVPMDESGGGWFAGVAMHDAMEGDFVKVMTEGTASVRFK